MTSFKAKNLDVASAQIETESSWTHWKTETALSVLKENIFPTTSHIANTKIEEK